MVAGNVGYVVAQGALIIVLARLGNPAIVGVFALGMALTTPIVVLSQLRLQDVQATDVSGEYLFKEYVWLTVVTSAIALATALGIAVSIGYAASTVRVVILIACSKIVESFSLLLYGLQQRHERMTRVGVSLIIRGFLGVACLTSGFVIGGRNLAWAVFGLLGANAVALVAIDIPQGKRVLREVSHLPGSATEMRRLVRLARTVLPLGLMTVLLSVTVSIPRVILERTAGESELGIFAAIAYVVVASTVVARAIGQATAPRLALAYVAGDLDRYRRLVIRLVLATTTIGCVAIAATALIGRPFLTLAYGTEYGNNWVILVLVMVYGATMFVALPLTQAMIAARRFVQQLFIFAVVVATAIGAGVILIPSHGMKGAALTMVAAGFVRLLGSWVILAPVLRRSAAPVGRDRPTSAA